METIVINDLTKIKSLTDNMINALIEAGVYCLEDSKHLSGINTKLKGDKTDDYEIKWNSSCNKLAVFSWGEEVIEWAAVAISILVATKITGYTAVERAMRGTGIDYWLGNFDDRALIFEQKERLEISGIKKGDDSAIKQRVNNKKKQTNQSASSKKPAHVLVVEFSRPEVNYAKN
ncbi:MAG: hypothetical protein ACD_46C00175G0002 [uncultured bacterium]|nr:MAG: hypothetical protein ACD_46C00175G0002 [uncultured bacterium]